MKWSTENLVCARELIARYGYLLYPAETRGSEGFRLKPQEIETMLQTYLINDTKWSEFLDEMEQLVKKCKSAADEKLARMKQREEMNSRLWRWFS